MIIVDSNTWADCFNGVGTPHVARLDCVIAQTCLDVGAGLLSPDADFEHIARHAPLQLWRT